ncbi:proteasome protein [Blastococcus sp. Marseille-P5729]|uniref:proteasome protein n=1 Tax=Blastococcus sp. Marseille-P5729 TaxID=2086582 RepID=UPI000D102D71|nr:proteasome protein [Blastococcus sp. Marseille-P5729]
MTVVLALKCSDGIVLASDTQITESGRGMSYPAPKLHPFAEAGAWGGSGSRAVLMEVEDEFEQSAPAMLVEKNISRAIQERVLPLMRHHYDCFIEDVPGEKPGGSPATYVMVAGYSDGEPFIVEINPHGLIGRYEEIGFHAIGSGAPMAQQAESLLAHFNMDARDVDHGVLVAVRVIEALKLTSPSVGGPTNVYRITEDGAEELSEEALEEVRDRIDQWVKLEREALDKLPASTPGNRSGGKKTAKKSARSGKKSAKNSAQSGKKATSSSK